MRAELRDHKGYGHRRPSRGRAKIAARFQAVDELAKQQRVEVVRVAQGLADVYNDVLGEDFEADDFYVEAHVLCAFPLDVVVTNRGQRRAAAWSTRR